MDKLIINNSETHYLIDREGKIYNTKTKRFQKITEKGTAQLTVNEKARTYTVSYLVACMYIDNPNNFSMTTHIDGDSSNNRVENIRWISNKENANNSAQKGEKIIRIEL